MVKIFLKIQERRRNVEEDKEDLTKVVVKLAIAGGKELKIEDKQQMTAINRRTISEIMVRREESNRCKVRRERR